MPLRRLTRFSSIELEKEQDELERDDRGARRDPRRRDACCARWSPTSSPRSPRPTAPRAAPCCSSRPAQPVTAGGRRSRSPTTRASCYLSSTGLLARTADAEPPGDGGGRAKHDVVVSAVRDHRPRRGRRASPSRGRLVRLGVLDLPDAARHRPTHPHLQGGAPVSEFLVARARRAGARA